MEETLGGATRSFVIRAKVFVACDVVFWAIRPY